MKRLLIGLVFSAAVCGVAVGAKKIPVNDPSGVTDIGVASTWGGTMPTASDQLYFYQGWVMTFALSNGVTLAGSNTHISDNTNTGYKDKAMNPTVDIYNGSCLTNVNTVLLKNQYAGSTSTLKVHGDGTRFYAGNISAQTGFSTVSFYDGAYARIGNISVGTDEAAGTVTNTLTVNGATVDVTGGVSYGQYVGYQANAVRKALLDGGAQMSVGGDFSLYDTSFVVSNATLKIANTHGDNDNGNLRLSRGAELELAGGCVTGTAWTVGLQRGYNYVSKNIPYRPAKIRITGGHHYARFIKYGLGDYMTGIVEVDGEDAVLEFGANFYGRLGYEEGATGIVNVVKGTMEVLPNTTQTLRIGAKKNAWGEINVSGGLFDYSKDCESGLWIGDGAGAYGLVNVSGGELRTCVMLLGTVGGATGEFRQSGGVVKVIKHSNSGGHIYMQGGATERVQLTGGELQVGRILAGENSTSSFVGDGGTVVATTAPNSPYSGNWFKNVASVTFGDGGLTFDTNGKASTMENAFADVSGEQGLFVKKGLGTLTVAGSYAVSKTRVEGGTLTLASASVPFATALTVKDGGIFSLAGAPTTATLSSLAVTNGTLKLDPTDSLVVTGPVSFDNLTVELVSLPAKDTPCNLLVATGELSAEAQDAWRHAVSLNIVDGQHVSFTFSYDEQTGKTTMTATLKDDAPLTDATTWTGSGAWGTDGNWSDGVPTYTKIADFSGTPASREVAVDAAATAGALSFAGGDYTLAGGKLTIDGEKGQARIDAAAGSSNVVTSAIRTWPIVLSKVEAGGTVELKGAITGGGVEKSGKGRLALGAANDFSQPVVQREGVLESAAAGALTTRSEVRHMKGAVKFSAEDTVTVPYRLKAAANTDLMTVNCATDVTFTDWRAENGRFMKRGAGTMTVKFQPNQTPTFYIGGAANSNQHIIPEDGSLPYRVSGGVTNYFPDMTGITVAEGPLVWTSDTPGLSISTIGGRVAVGLNAAKFGTAEAKFTIKDINVTFGNDPRLELGQASNRGCFSTNPTFELINSTTWFNTVQVGDWCYGLDSHPTVILTNSWLSGGSSVNLSQANGYANAKKESERAYVYWRAKDSKVSAGVNCSGFSWFGGLKLDFDHSQMSRKDDVCDKLTGMGQYSYGYMNFTNGSLFAINKLTGSGLTHDCTFRFAGSTWKTDADLSLASANISPVSYVHVESYAEGLSIHATAGKTFAFQDVALTGNGGIASTGAGTVTFANGMYQATGKIVAEAGVIDFTNAGTIENAVIGAGAGVIKGATFNNATIALGEVGGAVPNFENCTFTGKTNVTYDDDPHKAAGVTVANYTGTLSGVDTFRFRQWKGYRGTFAAKDGKLTVDIGYGKGLIITVR